MCSEKKKVPLFTISAIFRRTQRTKVKEKVMKMYDLFLEYLPSYLNIRSDSKAANFQNALVKYGSKKNREPKKK